MIVNAKIIGDGVSYDTYSRQAPGMRRGDTQFIMSRSQLVEMARCPAKWRDGKDSDDSTDATIFGSLVECMAGLNGKFSELYAVCPAEYKDEKTGAMKPWTFAANVCKAWREDAGDKEVIKADTFEKAKSAVTALASDGDMMELFQCSMKQVFVVGIWKDKATGILIPIRSLLDLVPDADHPIYGKMLGNFKTARNGDPNSWARVVDDMAYDVSAAMEMDIYCAATGEDRNTFLMPVQENVEPFHVVKPFVALTVEFIAWGRLKYQSALALYAKCLSENKWPSYSTGDRLVYGKTQSVGPDTLWTYRQSAGLGGNISDYFPPPDVSEKNDLQNETKDDQH